VFTEWVRFDRVWRKIAKTPSRPFIDVDLASVGHPDHDVRTNVAADLQKLRHPGGDREQ
jgi:hypothetical protein